MKKIYCDNCAIPILRDANEFQIALFYEAIYYEGFLDSFFAPCAKVVIPSSGVLNKKDDVKTYELCDTCYGTATKAAHEALESIKSKQLSNVQ